MHSSSDNPELDGIVDSVTLLMMCVCALDIIVWWSTILFNSSVRLISF